MIKNLEELKKDLLLQAPLKTRQHYLGVPGAPELKVQAGQLIEILGRGSFRWVIQFLKLHPLTRVAWVSSEAIELFPIAVAQESLALARVLFLEKVATPKAGALFMTLLRSKLFQVIVLDQALVNVRGSVVRSFEVRSFEVQMRKIQLVAEESGVVLVMLSRQATHSFTVNIQIDTAAQPGSAIQLRKVKGGTL